MSIFESVKSLILKAVHKVIPYQEIQSVVKIDTAVTPEMQRSLDLWYSMYTGHAPWIDGECVQSLNLPAFICSEISRQVTLEMKACITAKSDGDLPARDANGDAIMNPMSTYLSTEFEKCLTHLREKLEQACAAGGMVIKPYPCNGKLYFDFVMDWSMIPIAFDGAGNIQDVYFKDSYVNGKTIYTRLERHTVEGDNVRITQRVFKSTNRGALGSECELSEVPIWADLLPELIVEGVGGTQLFGWYRVASANVVDPESPLGVSIFAKAVDVIRDADKQYSNLLWEFEGSQLAVDVDPTILLPRQEKSPNGQTVYKVPQLNQRLFRAVDMGKDDTYKVFSPEIREGSIISGLDQILCRVEDLVGLARGTMSDTTTEALTATQLRILRQRSYVTVADNQKALERCLRDVLNAMSKYAVIYAGIKNEPYEVSFSWDDSIIVDMAQQANERIAMVNMGAYSKAEFREWYFGETPEKAKKAVAACMQETMDSLISSQVANAVLGNPDIPDRAEQVVEASTDRVDAAERNANRAMEGA